MSLVSISGGATGTGTFTVLAPSTNTNRTLTLPDATGTVLDSTGGTTQTALTVTNGASIQGLTVGKGANAVARNTAFGITALAAATGNFNTGIGNLALLTNSTGTSNTAVGDSALRLNTTGISNTAIGQGAIESTTTGSDNAAIGKDALASNTTGASNTALGKGALAANTTASNNTAVGYHAGVANTTGKESVAFGRSAGLSQTTAVSNCFIGTNAGGGVTTGGYNTFIGSGETGVTAGAGEFVTTGSKNTILGRFSGNQGSLDIRTASNHIVLSDGDGNPRGYFDASGNLLVGCTTLNVAGTNNTSGFVYERADALQVSRNNTVASFNRFSSDGGVININQDGTTEGNISVSGTTVSYNGGHLSRWAQTTTVKDDTLVKGTVLSNLDAMNVYTKDGQPVENEQLNKVKVSDVEGDANVAGVFVNWDHDEAHDVDEINMAMTGDMIIRIAQGTTVARGDLLMSAGDGTAKPQGDDIVRSKTVAKVTSTHVTCTYADGSFCVPCVLMAC